MSSCAAYAPAHHLQNDLSKSATILTIPVEILRDILGRAARTAAGDPSISLETSIRLVSRKLHQELTSIVPIRSVQLLCQDDGTVIEFKPDGTSRIPDKRATIRLSSRAPRADFPDLYKCIDEARKRGTTSWHLEFSIPEQDPSGEAWHLPPGCELLRYLCPDQLTITLHAPTADHTQGPLLGFLIRDGTPHGGTDPDKDPDTAASSSSPAELQSASRHEHITIGCMSTKAFEAGTDSIRQSMLELVINPRETTYTVVGAHNLLSVFQAQDAELSITTKVKDAVLTVMKRHPPVTDADRVFASSCTKHQSMDIFRESVTGYGLFADLREARIGASLEAERTKQLANSGDEGSNV